MSAGDRTPAVLVAALLVPLWVVSCFSRDPDELTGPVAADCRIALGSPVIGSVGVVVALRDFSFVPQEVRVPRGTRVTWVNCENANIDGHTTTSDDDVWGSDFMVSGESFSRVFDQAGRYPYHCIPHASFMRGIIVVE